MHPLFPALLLLSAASLAATAVSPARASTEPQRSGARTGWIEGDPAPPLRLPTIDGEDTVDLAALRGRRVLLIEFASW